MPLLERISKHRIFPLILWDSFGVFGAFLFALAFRFDARIPTDYLTSFIWTIPLVILLFCAVNIPFGLYAHIWRYTSAQEVVIIVGSTVTSTAVLILYILIRDTERPLPLSVVLLGGLFTVTVFTIIRYRQRVLTGLMGRLQRVVGSPDRKRVLIVGAGESGQSLARQLQAHNQHHKYELVGFVDDDPAKVGLHLHGVSILGNRQDIPRLIAERGVSLLIIAIHNISGSTLREVLSICLATNARVKIMPDFLRDMEDSKEALPLRDITPTDLLGRQPHQVDETACRELISGKIVLVTGAAGSIGSELCRQLFSFQPQQLLMLDNNESGLHDLVISFKQYPPSYLELEQRQPITEITPVVADITNPIKFEQIFKKYRPEVIFHAAAYKHVPMMELQPDEAVRVNVLGTKIAVELATRYAAERFVLISTDKAINPNSVMGATKRLGEFMILSDIPSATDHKAPVPPRKSGGNSLAQTGSNGSSLSTFQSTNCKRPEHLTKNGETNGQNPYSGSTLFTAVRFGNVLGSRGSVVPTFTRQIELGGPVTVTHPNMTRYFMSIAEAVSLVIQAATLTEGRDIFMLDMGQRIRIADLAQKMIRLRGLRPHQDIAIEYTGVRPGEKLHEEILGPDEERLATKHPKICRLRCNRKQTDGRTLADQISALIQLTYAQDDDNIVEMLWQLVQAKGEGPTADRKPSFLAHQMQWSEQVSEKRLWS